MKILLDRMVRPAVMVLISDRLPGMAAQIRRIRFRRRAMAAISGHFPALTMAKDKAPSMQPDSEFR